MMKRSLTARSLGSRPFLRQRCPWVGLASLVICSSILIPEWALAEKRSGPMLGLAIGPSNHFAERTAPTQSVIVFDPVTGDTHSFVRNEKTSRSNGGSLSIQLQLGYSFSSRFQTYLVQVTEIKTVSAVSPGTTTQVYATATMRALAFDYHPGHEAGPWFFGGGAGLSTLKGVAGSEWGWMVAGGRDLGRIAQLRLTLTHSRHDRDGYLDDRYTVAALFGLHWG